MLLQYGSNHHVSQTNDTHKSNEIDPCVAIMEITWIVNFRSIADPVSHKFETLQLEGKSSNGNYAATNTSVSSETGHT